VGGIPALTVVVIGAGPAGLMAAGEAAGSGARVTIVEAGDPRGASSC